MLKKSVLVALLVGCLTVPAAAQTLSKIVAVVNDEIITSYQLEQRLNSTPGAENSDQQRRQLLDMMIAEVLMQQRATEIGIEVSDEDIENAIGDVERQNNISREQLNQALQAQGMTMARYRQQLVDQILRYKLMGHEVQSKVDITRQEVRNYYQQHLDDYRQEARTRLSRLSFPVEGDPEKVRQNAQLARRKLLEGQSIDEVLVELSERGRIEGGEMGSFKSGELSATFEQALLGLEAGAVTEVIAVGDILHLLKVEEQIAGGIADLASVEEQISNRLRQKKMEEKLQQWRDELKKTAYIEVRL